MWFRTALLLTLGLPALAAGATDLPELTIEAGSQQPYVHSAAIKRVAIGDPKVASIAATSPKSLLITAKEPGATTLSIWSGAAAEPAARLRLVVTAASSLARERLGGDVAVDAAGPKLRLSGELSSLERHAQLLDTLSADPKKATVDATASGFDVQVQIDIKVVEVSRQRMMDAGFFFSRNNQNGQRTVALSSPGTLSGVESNTTTGAFTLLSNAGFLPNNSAFNFVYGSAAGGYLHALSALEANGFAYTLAEPSLTALSGQTAYFLAGGEMPIPLRTGGGSDASISITYKEFGVRLSLTPTVLDANRIVLRIAPEVSELDASIGVQTGGVSVPGLKVRRAETSVALGDGESFVIGGLVSRSTLGNVDKFPGLGDIPIIGAFFRSNHFDRQDKELLMVATTHLVRPLAKDARTPPLPGEQYRDYNPSYLYLMFEEKGQFNAGGGFSN